jgi:hypothetical protein
MSEYRDYFSKLDSSGQNPNGFVENFKLPKCIITDTYLDPSYKKVIEEHESRIRARQLELQK